MELKLLDGEFSVCRLNGPEGVDFSAPFLFIGKTDEEFSVVCPTEYAPKTAAAAEHGWRAMRILGELDFSLTGILARLAGILAQNDIPIFAVSTYNTDYIFIKSDTLFHAVDCLQQAGHRFVS
ncbi:MAG TPA: ACT domain-containing protein [Feifaniaceae bacterium]|nr:ACT domain-containing protein [Feifaniaceae bacterium]